MFVFIDCWFLAPIDCMLVCQIKLFDHFKCLLICPYFCFNICLLIRIVNVRLFVCLFLVVGYFYICFIVVGLLVCSFHCCWLTCMFVSLLLAYLYVRFIVVGLLLCSFYSWLVPLYSSHILKLDLVLFVRLLYFGFFLTFYILNLNPFP